MLKAIWNIIPTIIGIVESLLPLIKELVVAVVRIIAVLPFMWSDAEDIIIKINQIYDVIYNWFEKIKNFLLLIPTSSDA